MKRDSGAAAVRQAQAAYDYAQNFITVSRIVEKPRTISANGGKRPLSSRDRRGRR